MPFSAILCPGIFRFMNRNLASYFAMAQADFWLAFVLVAVLVQAAFGQQAAVVSPELHKDGSVTFRLNQSGAHQVLVALAGWRLR